MLKDELLQHLTNSATDIQTIKTYWEQSRLEERCVELEYESQSPNFWQKPELGKELQKLKNQREQYYYICNAPKELSDLIHLFAPEEHELQKLRPDVFKLLNIIKKFKMELMLHKPEDSKNCFVSINAGAGGTESQDWADILLRMILRYCERLSFTIELLDYQSGEGAGIKSATILVKGKNCFGLLKSEHGIHRLVRISPFDANKRRHTSFAGISVIPEADDLDISINPADLRIDTYRAGGAGGQHVNKTDSAVRITHIPTGIVTQCQSERSQTQNKETAMKMLRAKFAQKLRDEDEAKRSASIEKKKIEWGSQIRSYVLHPYKMVKDHRTDHESPEPDLILDGDLIDFVEKYLIWINSAQ